MKPQDSTSFSTLAWSKRYEGNLLEKKEFMRKEQVLPCMKVIVIQILS